jgi:hypothetical protein
VQKRSFGLPLVLRQKLTQGAPNRQDWLSHVHVGAGEVHALLKAGHHIYDAVEAAAPAAVADSKVVHVLLLLLLLCAL